MIFCWCYAKCFRWRHQFSRNSFIFNFFSRLENLNHFANVLGEIDRAVVFIVFVIIGGISFSTFANQGSIHSTRCAFFGLFIFVQCTFSPAKWWFVSSSYSLTISLQWIEFNGIKYLYLFKKLIKLPVGILRDRFVQLLRTQGNWIQEFWMHWNEPPTDRHFSAYPIRGKHTDPPDNCRPNQTCSFANMD